MQYPINTQRPREPCIDAKYPPVPVYTGTRCMAPAVAGFVWPGLGHLPIAPTAGRSTSTLVACVDQSLLDHETTVEHADSGPASPPSTLPPRREC